MSLVPSTLSVARRRKSVADCQTETDVLWGLVKQGMTVQCVGLSDDLAPLTLHIGKFKPHILFNLLEEFRGDPLLDQNVVAHLELMGLSFTGCQSKGLLLARDKVVSKQILIGNGVPTPRFWLVQKDMDTMKPSHVDYPLMVKSLYEDGSLGLAQASVVNSQVDLSHRIDYLRKNVGASVLVEEYIPGTDVYLSMMGDQNPVAFPPLEMEFGRLKKSGFPIATRRVKWDGKYRFKNGIKVRPSQLPPSVHQKLISYGKIAYRCLHLTGYARFDFRVTPNGEVFFLEANPNPDIGKDQEFARSAQLAGLTYPELLKSIVSLPRRDLSHPPIAVGHY